MTFQLWFIVFLLGWGAPAIGMDVITLNSQQGAHDISRSVHVLEDAAGLLTIEEILDPSRPLNWIRNSKDVANFGFTDKVYWIRMQFHNAGLSVEPWFLELSYSNHDYVDFYAVQQSGSFTHSFTGDRRPFARRDVLYRNFTFKLDIPPGESRTFYMRSKSESSMQFPLHVWTPTAFAEKINREVFGHGIYYGMMLVIILYNLFIFFWLRNLNYLVYVLYIATFAIYQASINGFVLEYIVPTQPDLANQCVPISGSFAALFALIFARTFLQTSKNCPKFDRIMRFFILASLCFLALAFFTSYATSIKFGSVMILLAIPCLLISSTLCLRRGYRPARYFMAAFLALLIGTFLYHLRNLGYFPSFFFTDYANQIGSSVEVILLSLALADKIKLEQLENQTKIEGLNAKLEKHIRDVEHEVDEKTRDIKSILENIKQGIFMILPNGFRIHKDHSTHLNEILERDDIEQSNAIDLLFQHARFSPDVMNQIRSVLEASLDQDEINFMSNSHCLPHELLYRATRDGPEKNLSVDWSPIIGSDHRIEKILVAIRDETSLRKLQAQARSQERELEYISQILEIPLERFSSFLDIAYGYLDQNENLIRSGSPLDQQSLRLLFINTHTLKGMARNLAISCTLG